MCKLSQGCEMISTKLLIVVIGMFFMTSCGIRNYASEAQCKSHIGKECQQACNRMGCSDVLGGKCFSEKNNWDWFMDLKDPGAYTLKSSGTKHPFLMIREDGKMYLIMEGDLNQIQPGYGLRPTIAIPPRNYPFFHPMTFSALESEGFQCTGTLSNVWISKEPWP